MSSKDSINLCVESDESTWQYKDMSGAGSKMCPAKSPRRIPSAKDSPRVMRSSDELITSNRRDEDDFEYEEDQSWQRVPVSKKRITLDRNQRKLQKILFDLELIPLIDFRSLGMFAVEMNIATVEQWLDYLDALTDLKREDKWSIPNIESSALFKVYSMAIRNLIHTLSREQLSHMRYYFMCLKQTQDELKAKESEQINSTVTREVGGGDDLDNIYIRKIPERKQLSFRSWSTLKFDREPVTFVTNRVNNSNYLIDMKLFDLDKISQENLGTSTMWKDAIVRMKFYGNSNMDFEPYQLARNLASRSINVIETRENITEHQPITPYQFMQPQIIENQPQSSPHHNQQQQQQQQQQFQQHIFYPPPQKKKSRKSSKKNVPLL